MERHVFSEGFLGTIIFNIIFIPIVFVIYFKFFNHIAVFLLLIFSLKSILSVMKNRLIIQNGNLRLEKLTKTKEISLDEVAQIFLDRKETTDSDGSSTTISYMNVIDKAGHSILTFSNGYISSKVDHQRFIDAVHAVNPGIEMSFVTDFDNLKIMYNDYRNYKEEKKNTKHK